MKALKIIDRLLYKFEQFILSYSIIAMAIILIGNVISRSVFNRSWTFAEEVGQFLTIMITFMGISFVARKGRHINMSAFFDALPRKAKKIMILVISMVTALALFYLTFLCAQFTLKVYGTGRVTPALMVPMYLVYMMVPLGFFMGGIQYLINFVMNLQSNEIFIGTEKVDRSCGVAPDGADKSCCSLTKED